MAGLKFSVPYNNRLETLNALGERFHSGSNRICEVYFSGPPEFSGSGRAVPKITTAHIRKAICLCHAQGWDANLLVNSTCGGLGWYRKEQFSRTLRYIKSLHEKHGLDSVTVANPIYLQKIKEEIPKIKTVASVLCCIDTVQKASFYDNFGVDVIIPDRDINRDLEKLKLIREAVDAEIRLMVNEGCLYGCPYRQFHFNLISHNSKEDENQRDCFFSDCQHIARKDPSQILKSCWIRPEDLRKYRKITNHFKVTGRTRSTEWILNTTHAYFCENYGGNLLELMDSSLDAFRQTYHAYLDNKSLDGFFEKVAYCKKNCGKCRYCDGAARSIVKFKKGHDATKTVNEIPL